MRPFRTGALLALLLLLTPAVTACSDGAAADDNLIVLGPWLDEPGNANDEADVFSRVVTAWGREHDLTVTYQGTRAIGQALRAKVKDGTPPDIAIMPNVGELAGYATEDLARPVTSLVKGGRPAADNAVTVDHRALWRGDQAYAVAIKTDLKSLLIFGPGANPSPPVTLDQLRTTVDRRQWCLGLSEASAPGWPGTDWVEDLLLHQAGRDAYQAWASGATPWTSAPVRDAFQEFRGHYVPDPRTALFNSPGDAAADLAAGKCQVMHQSSFYGGRTGLFFLFPQSARGVEVSGDFAARFTAKPAAEDLLKHLTAESAAWVAASNGLVFPLEPDPAAYPGTRPTVATLLSTASARCLDASDAMPPAMASAFQNAILEYVADDPSSLDQVLIRLEEVRKGIPRDQFLDVVCSR